MVLRIRAAVRLLRVTGEPGRPIVPLGVKSPQDPVFRAETQGRAHSARDVTARRASPSLPSINIFGPIRPLLRVWLLGVLLLGGSVYAQETENQPPEKAYELYDEVLRVGVPQEVSIGYGFEDPDDDPLTYTASSSDTGVVSVTVSEDGPAVALTPKAIGTATITVTATDTGGSDTSVEQDFTVTVARNYDTDNDRLIEITTLTQLDAIRHDLDGNGNPAHGNASAYAEAFPQGGVTERGYITCSSRCAGYELEEDLDFDTDRDGVAGAGDAYWNEGAGWMPIGTFSATFDGNGHTIRNLFIKREDALSAGYSVGLFDEIDSPGVLRNVELIDVDVTGGKFIVGGLVGSNDGGTITASYVTGRVVGMHNIVGGLVGSNDSGTITASSFTGHVEGEGSAIGGLAGTSGGSITESYATGQVAASSHVGGLVGINSGNITASYATACVVGRSNDAGGLVGENEGTITASYATGSVASRIDAGGLVGSNVGKNAENNIAEGTIAASYATGSVAGRSNAGGLVGRNVSTGAEGTITASYWDTDTSGMDVGVGTDDADNNGSIDGTESQTAGAAGKTTAQLQEPTDYTGIYETWDDNDDMWDFGENDEYPVLVVDFDGDETASWEEFGYQFRESIVLTATLPEGVAQVDLAWTGLAVDHWDPEPDVSYVLVRDDGTTVETLSENTAAGDYSDLSVTPGTTYTYRVAVVVTGSEAACTGVSVTIPADANQAPQTVGTLADQTLRVGTPETVNAAGAFQDPDNDTLDYTATSADQTVVTVSMTGAVVTITPVAVGGPATVTVTATDTNGSNTSVTQKFRVTVTSPPPNRAPPNRAPQTVGTLADQTLHVGTPETVNVAGAFRDPDNDTLDYAASSNNAVVTVSMTGAVVTLTPVTVGGPATITVTATDTNGSNTSVTQQFQVNVEAAPGSDNPPPDPPPPPNQRPQPVGTLDALTLQVGQPDETVDVENGFEDQDNDTLTYGATSNAASIVEVVSVAGSVVTLRPLAVGTAIITVTATDEGGSNTPATQRFTVTVEASNNNPPTNTGPVGSNSPGTQSRSVSRASAQRSPAGHLEIPEPNSVQSGIGVIAGWICEAKTVEVEVEIDGHTYRLPAAYGTDRADTRQECGDMGNGFGLLFNWNLLGDGVHRVAILVDREPWRRLRVQVKTLGEEFVEGAEGRCEVANFPRPGEGVTLVWQESQQNFVITDGSEPPTGDPALTGEPLGFLENPAPNSFQSGIGIISGWVCEARTVDIEINGTHRLMAAYGTDRADTEYTEEGEELCGDTDNGFGLLFNWNLLDDGEHTIVALVDGEPWRRATVRVTTLGEEFVEDAAGMCEVADFPGPPDYTVTLRWQEAKQNFVITDVK